MSTLFCTNCRASLKEDARFCTSCGQPVLAAATGLAEQPRVTLQLEPDEPLEDTPASRPAAPALATAAPRPGLPVVQRSARAPVRQPVPDADTSPRRRVILYALLGLTVLSIALAGGYMSMSFANAGQPDPPAKARTEGAAVRIISAEPTQWADEEGVVNGYNVEYEFSVNGQTYRQQSGQNKDYNPNLDYKICYNPNDPNDNSLAFAVEVCSRGP